MGKGKGLNLHEKQKVGKGKEQNLTWWIQKVEVTVIFNKREGNTETYNCDFQGFSIENAWIWALWVGGIKFLRSGLYVGDKLWFIFNFISILKVEIWSLSIDLTGYKSPISKSKVGVLGVSMSSIALVIILLILAILFS